MSKDRILITGAAGFVGSNLSRKLLDRGYAVLGLDNFSQGFRRNLSSCLDHEDFTLIEADVRDMPALERAARGVRAIIHLAAFKIPRYGNAFDTLTINIDGTRNVLEAGLANKARVVMASTSDVYGKNPEVPFHEESALVMGPPTVRRWSYAISKMFDEQLALAYAEKYGI